MVDVCWVVAMGEEGSWEGGWLLGRVGFSKSRRVVDCRGRFDGGVDVVRRVVVFVEELTLSLVESQSMWYHEGARCLQINAHCVRACCESFVTADFKL